MKIDYTQKRKTNSKTKANKLQIQTNIGPKLKNRSTYHSRHHSNLSKQLSQLSRQLSTISSVISSHRQDFEYLNDLNRFIFDTKLYRRDRRLVECNETNINSFKTCQTVYNLLFAFHYEHQISMQSNTYRGYRSHLFSHIIGPMLDDLKRLHPQRFGDNKNFDLISKRIGKYDIFRDALKCTEFVAMLKYVSLIQLRFKIDEIPLNISSYCM